MLLGIIGVGVAASRAIKAESEPSDYVPPQAVRDEPREEHAPEPIELADFEIVDCDDAGASKKHQLCTNRHLKRFRRDHDYLVVDLPSGDQRWEAIWVWRHECATTTRVRTRKIRRDKAVTVTECQRRALQRVELANGSPSTLLTEHAPALHDEFMAQGRLVIPVFEQGPFGAFEFQGWSLRAYVAGAEEPSQHAAQPTDFERHVDRF